MKYFACENKIALTGSLYFVDRKKDLMKLQMGEYISPGKVESVLKTSPLVENICLCGDSTKNYCVALIAPHRENLIVFAANKGVTNKTFRELCEDDTVTKAVLQEIANYGKQGKFNEKNIEPLGIT